MTVFSGYAGALDVYAGHGGVVSGAQNGGAGGAARDITLTVVSNGGSLGLQVIGGDGSTGTQGTGGHGGEVARVKINSVNGTLDGVVVRAGGGGFSNTNIAGNGGALSNVALTLGEVLGSVITFGGPGGNALHAGGTGGDGGDVSGVVAKAKVLTSSLAILAGSGGNGLARGGDGGNVEGTKFTSPNVGGNVNLNAGDGASASGSGDGGAGGALTKNSVIASANVEASITFSTGSGGNTNSGLAAMSGANSGVNITVTQGVEDINVDSGNGGNVGDSAFTATVALLHAQAGDGGGSANAVGGKGGDVMRLKIAGEIGNFAQLFGSDYTKMGGIIAGLGGSSSMDRVNGSIANITAKRIPAIYAGEQIGTINSNAFVTSISNITASVIGADLDGDDTFDFSDVGSPGFGLSTGDTAIDGLVIVKTDGFDDDTVGATPLRVLSV